MRSAHCCPTASQVISDPAAPGPPEILRLPQGLLCGWSCVWQDGGRRHPDVPRSCTGEFGFLNTTSLHFPMELQACRWLDEHVVSGCDMKVSICVLFVWVPWVCLSCPYGPEILPIVFMLRQELWRQSAVVPGSAGPRLHHPSAKHQRDPEEPSTEPTEQALGLQGTCPPPHPCTASAAEANCNPASPGAPLSIGDVSFRGLHVNDF